jgi:hypothetical protein
MEGQCDLPVKHVLRRCVYRIHYPVIEVRTTVACVGGEMVRVPGLVVGVG